MSDQEISIFWFRRDLRLEDNAALWMALKAGVPVLPIFIFDVNILDQLGNKKDARVLFIHGEVMRLKAELEALGSSLQVFYDTPEAAFQEIIKTQKVTGVFANRDYESYARERDKKIYDLLAGNDITFKAAKDHVIFEKDEVTKDDGLPYTVFTPYSKKWKAKLNSFYLSSYPTKKYFANFLQCAPFKMPSLKMMKFEDFNFEFFPKKKIDADIVKDYEKTRDFPAIRGTTHASLHLRFGTVSIRELCRIGQKLNDKWLGELIWRDFYQSIIYHFPYSERDSFKPQYDRIQWLNDESQFAKWCEGMTGYPMVDAGMRELNQTGFMHNRVRMVVASFLSKHLLIDWRWGERYFAEKLLDYELASNTGGWQWAAGCGCDAAPYFRIFNPESQLEKFDKEKKYVRKWVPEYGGSAYPPPMVDHKMARERCLEVFKKALQ